MNNILRVLLIAAPMTVAAADPVKTETALFAGGCFWCTESDFEKVLGVISAVSGYTGGRVENPGYDAVSAGSTGHTEAVQVRFDPTIISYEKLLGVFWKSIDPTVKDQQFCDSGSQYRSGIYPMNPEQLKLAEASKAALEKSGRFQGPIYTEIKLASAFYAAEDYHQDYYKKNPLRYNWYRTGCGRDRRLEQLWGEQAGH